MELWRTPCTCGRCSRLFCGLVLFVTLISLSSLNSESLRYIKETLQSRLGLFSSEQTSQSQVGPSSSHLQGNYSCYDSRRYSAGLGHQILAMAVIHSLYGDMFRIVDPIASTHTDINQESYSTFINASLIIPQSLKYEECAVLLNGYLDVGVGTYLGEKAFLLRRVVPFHKTVLLCDKENDTNTVIPIPDPDTCVAVKIRLSDINTDERRSLHLSIQNYCSVLTTNYTERACVVMTDGPRLPCRSDCTYLDDIRGYSSKSQELVCNLRTLAECPDLITLYSSNLQKVIDSFLFMNGKPHTVVDVASKTVIDWTVGFRTT